MGSAFCAALFYFYQKKIVKVVGKIFAVFFILVFVACVSLWFYTKTIEERIVHYAVKEINSKISVPINVNSIQLNLFKSFPFASIVFEDLLIHDFDFKRQEYTQDTLCYVETLAVGSNLWKVLNKDYTIDYLEINNAIVHFHVDNQGYVAWNNFSKEDASSSNPLSLQLNVEKVRGKHIRLIYNNDLKKNKTEIFVQDISAKGSVNKHNYVLQLKSQLNIESYQSGELAIRNLHDLQLDYNLKFHDKQLEILKGQLRSPAIDLEANGQLIWVEEGTDIHVNMSSSHIDFNYLNQTLISQNMRKAKVTDLKGQSKLNVSIQGLLNKSCSPYVEANFVLDRVGFGWAGTAIKSLSLNGYYTNGLHKNSLSSVLQLKNLTLETAESNLSGSFYLNNFEQPTYHLLADLALDLSEWQSLLPKEIQMAGRVQGNVSSHAKLHKSNNNDLWKTILKQSAFNLAINNVSFKGASNLNIKQFSGEILGKDDVFNIRNLNALVNNTSIHSSSLSCENLSALYLKDANTIFQLKGDALLGDLNYAKISSLGQDDTEKTTNQLSYNILLNLSCKSFQYQDIHLTNISGLLGFNNEAFRLQNFNCNAFSGSVYADMIYQLKENHCSFKADGKSIQITKLLEQTNDLGQKEITREHLFGLLSGSVEGSFSFQNTHLNTASINLMGTLELEEGKLIHYPPVMRLSEFTKLEELGNLQFNTLNSSFIIRENTLYIADTKINSNSFDMEVSGNQNFNGDYHYYMRVYLSDILKGKSAKLRKQQSAYGLVEEDGLGRTSLFLHTSRTNGVTNTQLDKEGLKSHLKGRGRDESNAFKKALYDEFGFFKKDTASFKSEERKQKEFEIEW